MCHNFGCYHQNIYLTIIGILYHHPDNLEHNHQHIHDDHHQLEDEEAEEESYLVPSLLTDQLNIDDAVRPYDLVGFMISMMMLMLLTYQLSVDDAVRTYDLVE